MKRRSLFALVCLLFATEFFGQVSFEPAVRKNLRAQNINKIRLADEFSGSNAGSKISAARVDLPSSGGTVDARGLDGSQSWTSCPVSGETRPVTVILGPGTTTYSANCTIPASVRLIVANGGKLVASGGAALTVQGQLVNENGVFEPEILGAAGDGSTDDLAAFRMLNTALPTGAEIHFRTGKTYKVTKSIRLNAGRTFDLHGSTLRFVVTGNCLGLQMANDTEVRNGTIDVQISGHDSGATGDVGAPIVIGDDLPSYNNENCTGTGHFGTEPHNVRVLNMTLTSNRAEGYCAFCIFNGYNISVQNLRCPASSLMAICFGVTAGVNDDDPTSKSYHPYNIFASGIDIGNQSYTATSPFEPAAVAVSGGRSGIVIENVFARTITSGPLLRYSASDQGISRLGVRAITAGGSGYSNASGVATTGGSGTGITVDITTTMGAVTSVVLNSKGTGGYVETQGYLAGETLTISGGGGNATFTIEAPEPEIVHSFMHATEFKNFTCIECKDRGAFLDSVGDNAVPSEVVYTAPVLFSGFKLRGDGGNNDIGARVARAKNFILERFDVSNFGQGIWIDDNSERITLRNSRSYFNGDEGVLVFSSMLTDPIDTVIDQLEAFSNGQDGGGDGASGVHDYGTRTTIMRSIFGHATVTSETSQSYGINIDETAVGATIKDNYCRSVRTQVGGVGGGICFKLGSSTSYSAIREFTSNRHYPDTLTWAPSTAYTLGQTVRRLTWDNEFCIFQVTVAGTSGGSEPAWSCTTGGSTVDNTVTWHAQEVRVGIPLSKGTLVDTWCSTYPPVFTAVANTPTFAVPTELRYCRSGDIVTVELFASLNGVAAAGPTQTQFGVLLPVRSNLATTNVDLYGSGGVATITEAGSAVIIYADTTNDRAQVEFNAAITTAQSVYGSFAYRVIR